MEDFIEKGKLKCHVIESDLQNEDTFLGDIIEKRKLNYIFSLKLALVQGRIPSWRISRRNLR